MDKQHSTPGKEKSSEKRMSAEWIRRRPIGKAKRLQGRRNSEVVVSLRDAEILANREDVPIVFGRSHTDPLGSSKPDEDTLRRIAIRDKLAGKKPLYPISEVKISNDVPKAEAPARVPMILITDIGADIDDTIALFVLCGALDMINLVAIVTSVGDGIARGCVARGWLRALGIKDEEVEVLPTVDDCKAGCFVPPGFPTPKDACLGDVKDTPRRILELCRKYKGEGMIIGGIASLKPLADAIRIDREKEIPKCISKLYLQGSLVIKSKKVQAEQRIARKKSQRVPRVTLTAAQQRATLYPDNTASIEPDFQAYNFKNDPDGTRLVFDTLSKKVPFVVAGKFAAYKIGFTKGDFARFNQINKKMMELQGKRLVQERPDMLDMARKQMNAFRKGNPEKFYSIYDVDEKYKKDLDDTAWFDDLGASAVVSHPYDPLLMFVLVGDLEKQRARSGDAPLRNAPVKESPVFFKNKVKESPMERAIANRYVFVVNKKKRFGTRIMHTVLGNSEARHGINDSTWAHKKLMERIRKGLQLRP